MPAVLGPILGPVVGGPVLDHLSWPWLCWVNVPFAVAGIVLAFALIPHDGPVQRAPLDLVGVALMALSLVSLVAGILLLSVFLLWAPPSTPARPWRPRLPVTIPARPSGRSAPSIGVLTR